MQGEPTVARRRAQDVQPRTRVVAAKHRLRDAIATLGSKASDAGLIRAAELARQAADELDAEHAARALERAQTKAGYDPDSEPLLDARGRKRSPAAMPGFLAGREPANKGKRYPASPPAVDEIVAMLNACGDDIFGRRLHALILLLWRAGLRISEALALTETDLDRDAGTVHVREGKGGKSGTVGIDDWIWPLLEPWLKTRRELPVGPLFCVVQGSTAGKRAWGYPSARRAIAQVAKTAGVRRRMAPHQLRHSFAVEIMTEGHPMIVLQRSLRHANLQVTTIYTQAFPQKNVIDAIRGRPMPTLPAFSPTRPA